MKPDVLNYLESKFLTAEKFAIEIGSMVGSDTNYIDAICAYCAEREIEIETVSSLIVGELREKVEVDARRLNFLKGRRGRLIP